jgi:hypothetical protein
MEQETLKKMTSQALQLEPVIEKERIILHFHPIAIDFCVVPN